MNSLNSQKYNHDSALLNFLYPIMPNIWKIDKHTLKMLHTIYARVIMNLVPSPFLKINKSALILGKNAQIVSILRLNLPFKM